MMYNLNIRRRPDATKAEGKKSNITLLTHRKWCRIFQAVLMYLIAINKIIKCLLFLFLYSLLFFPFSKFLLLSFHCIFIFFHFSATFYKIILFCPYFLVFASCCFSSICHRKFSYMMSFFSLQAFFLPAKKQEYPLNLLLFLSLHGFTKTNLFHWFYFCHFCHCWCCVLHRDIVFSWLKNPFPLHPQSSKCLLLCLPMMHHKTVSYMRVLYIPK